MEGPSETIRTDALPFINALVKLETKYKNERSRVASKPCETSETSRIQAEEVARLSSIISGIQISTIEVEKVAAQMKKTREASGNDSTIQEPLIEQNQRVVSEDVQQDQAPLVHEMTHFSSNTSIVVRNEAVEATTEIVEEQSSDIPSVHVEEPSIKDKHFSICPYQVSDEDISEKLWTSSMIFCPAKPNQKLDDSDIVLMIKEMIEALERRLKRKTVISESVLLKSKRILIVVDLKTRMDLMADRFHVVTSHFGEFLQCGRNSLKHYPCVAVENVIRSWSLDEICEGLNTNLASKYTNVPFRDIRSEIFGLSRLDNITKPRNPNTALGTTVNLNVSHQLFDLVGQSWGLHCHGRRVHLAPVQLPRVFCTCCCQYMFHDEGMCTGDGPRPPPSPDREDAESQDMKSHLHVLTFKQKKRAKKICATVTSVEKKSRQD